MLRAEFASLCLALQFLTRVPIPRTIEFSSGRERGAVKYYPLVGVFVGAVAALIWWLAQFWWPGLLAVLLSMLATVLVTGAFHEDGLADTFDGIGGGSDQAKILAIMKDSRLGTYGVMALLFAGSLKLASLLALSENGPLLILALVLAHGLSRLSSVLVIASSRYVRSEGTAKPTADGISTAGLIVVGLTGAVLICAAFLYLPSVWVWAALGGLTLGHLCSRLLYIRKVGGYTGDCLGATQQISEIGFYLGLVACL